MIINTMYEKIYLWQLEMKNIFHFNKQYAYIRVFICMFFYLEVL